MKHHSSTFAIQERDELVLVAPTLTHLDIVNRCAKWLVSNHKCKFVLREYKMMMIDEEPDVLGFDAWGNSVLIEVKISRADFLRDKKKKHRWPLWGGTSGEPGGLGKRRFYACPDGLIKPDELPDGWGLIYVTDKKLFVVKEAIVRQKDEYNRGDEMMLILNAARRATGNEPIPELLKGALT